MIPTMASPSTTGSRLTSLSTIRRAASDSSAPPGTVTTSVVIRSPTFFVLFWAIADRTPPDRIRSLREIRPTSRRFFITGNAVYPLSTIFA